MITLASVRDYIKTFNLFEGHYIGRIDANKTNVLGVYNLRSNARHKCIGDAQKYDVKGISLLIHGSANKNATEVLANKLYQELEQADGGEIEGKKIYIIELLQDGPIDVDVDNNKIYEYVIECRFYTERTN